MSGSGNFDKILEKILLQDNLDPALVKEILQIELERSTTPVEVQVAKLNAANDPVEVQVAKINASSERRKPWFRWIPWAGLFTILGGVGTAIVTGVFDYANNSGSQSHEIRIETLHYESSVFDKLLIISDTPPISDKSDPLEQIAKIEAFKHEERRNRICLAASFGLIRIPDYLIVAEPTDRKAYKDEVESFLSQYGCKGGEIPTALPAPVASTATEQENCPLPTLQIVRNRLAYPADINISGNHGDTLLSLALHELNKGIHEVCNSARVGEYWSSVGLELNGLDRQQPWSGAFLSWLISESGNIHDLQISPTNIKIWRSALSKSQSGEADITFLPTEGEPRRGDILFLTRGRGPFDLDALRTETDGPLVRSHTGIIYSTSDESIRYISGNTSHMVKYTDIPINSDQIIGYIRP